MKKMWKKLLGWITEFKTAAVTQQWTRPMYITFVVHLTVSLVFGIGFLFMSTALLFAGVGGMALWALMYSVVLLFVALVLLRVPVWAEGKKTEADIPQTL